MYTDEQHLKDIEACFAQNGSIIKAEQKYLIQLCRKLIDKQKKGE